MALQVSISDSIVGVPFAESYANIQFARMNKTQAFIFVNWYANAAARWANKAPVLQKEYAAPTGSLVEAPFTAIYSFLKSHPDFAGAIDILDDSEHIEVGNASEGSSTMGTSSPVDSSEGGQ
jgi:hypothetical protein